MACVWGTTVSVQAGAVAGTAAPAAQPMAVSVPGGAVDAKARTPAWPWKKYFPLGQSLTPVGGLRSGDEAFEVRDAAGHGLGWVFRTDRVAPSVKGFNGPIGVLVALSKEGKIIGVAVLENRETPRYFARLTDTFHRQFSGRRVTDDPKDVDAVTGATISSRAVIRDVFQSAAEVLKAVQEPTAPAS